ncbi:MAG TPA: hypothetical protein VFW29_06270 [Solirubrobacteraceae bacterium]|nr:hypothetical protein [Solirubrobacteraceae bacterium]
MNGRQVHRTGTLVLSAAMVVIGFALLVQAIASSAGSPLLRIILAVLFIAAGFGRTLVESRRSRGG